MTGLAPETALSHEDHPARLRLRVRGAVQGVGFRPFVYRLARSLGLSGFVANSPHGVTIEIEGQTLLLSEFCARLKTEGPPRAALTEVDAEWLLSRGAGRFEIRDSDVVGPKTAAILPDVATCPECAREISDPTNRRFRYPFTNCTSCGPRYTIILGLPYDRERTTMERFTMCSRCRREYEDPLDRRFHAEANACPECGPSLELWDEAGHTLATRDQALETAAASLKKGRVVAVKGIGGFHLFVDARDEDAVRRLRQRKQRQLRPFAVMAPSLAWARNSFSTDAATESLLASPEAPIVLLQGPSRAVAASVAPGVPTIGLMLPYAPLHHLLMQELGFPVVATSGNISDEPICVDEYEALVRLSSIANLFLVHDRRIAHRADDSVARIMVGRPTLLRRGRGYAPMSVAHSTPCPPLLAVGGQLKNTVALALGEDIFLSPHVGDLESPLALEGFRETVCLLEEFYGVKPQAVACELQEDSVSTQEARRLAALVIPVQHHHAHILAGMADHGLKPPLLGFAWDGGSYGGDGTLWGGETLRVLSSGFSRVASFRLFPLPGGEKAAREPRRSALGALYSVLGRQVFLHPGFRSLHLFTEPEIELLQQVLADGKSSPLTSSVGRLFEAVAALLGLSRVSAFEGQAAMALEAALSGAQGDASYPFTIESPAGSPSIVDLGDALVAVLQDVTAGAAPGLVSLRFHNTLAEVVVAVARGASASRVMLTGGCFQNRYLLERAVAGLRREGIEAFWSERIPPNDGGLAVGQILAAAPALGAA